MPERFRRRFLDMTTFQNSSDEIVSTNPSFDNPPGLFPGVRLNRPPLDGRPSTGGYPGELHRRPRLPILFSWGCPVRSPRGGHFGLTGYFPLRKGCIRGAVRTDQPTQIELDNTLDIVVARMSDYRVEGPGFDSLRERLDIEEVYVDLCSQDGPADKTDSGDLSKGCAEEEDKSPRCRKRYGGRKWFICEQCDYMTNVATNFKNHKMMHSGEKPFLCDECDYRTIRMVDLKSHKRVHTGEKPFACDRCDYKTARSIDLKNHMLKHTGEKPFLCDRCDYRTGRMITLKRHKRTHTGEKPFACDLCHFRTSQTVDLKRHRMSHSGERPLGCDLCEYRTVWATDLKRHRARH
ncbi:hypothetical protein AAG570_007350 [Ranatra chinensis]|uniref:C2H2-type domain-containing protein n=1 Tax=Ranatra chinensis TaxID=642074 RepID=A0ABD0XXH7_9HEMI